MFSRSLRTWTRAYKAAVKETASEKEADKAFLEKGPYFFLKKKVPGHEQTENRSVAESFASAVMAVRDGRSPLCFSSPSTQASALPLCSPSIFSKFQTERRPPVERKLHFAPGTPVISDARNVSILDGGSPSSSDTRRARPASTDDGDPPSSMDTPRLLRLAGISPPSSLSTWQSAEANTEAVGFLGSWVHSFC